jgi:hypothetical protein
VEDEPHSLHSLLFFAPATAADCTVGAGRPTTRSDEAKKKPKEEEVDEYNWEKERKEEEKIKGGNHHHPSRACVV